VCSFAELVFGNDLVFIGADAGIFCKGAVSFSSPEGSASVNRIKGFGASKGSLAAVASLTTDRGVFDRNIPPALSRR
jgi:hypothetical protein